MPKPTVRSNLMASRDATTFSTPMLAVGYHGASMWNSLPAGIARGSPVWESVKRCSDQL